MNKALTNFLMSINNHDCPTKPVNSLLIKTSPPTPSPKERRLRTLNGNEFRRNVKYLAGQ
jgi:hypothetical protein